MIDDSKLKARQNSVNGLMNAVNMTYTKSQLTESPLKLPITATINNGVITILDENNNPIEVEYTGDRPESGTIIIDENGELTAISIEYNDGYNCSIDNDESICAKNILTLPGIVNDPDENTRLIFRGETPNNYIYLKEESNDVLYRIVAIETDGTIKVMRNSTVTNMPYDSNNTGDVNGTTGPRQLTSGTYCNYNSSGIYYGCNAWSAVNGTYTNGSTSGTVTTDSEIKTYLNTTFYNRLATSTQNIIVEHDFKLTPSSHIGIWASGIGLDASTLYANNKGSNTWTGKVGLIELRDWFNATTNSECDPDREDGLGGGYYNNGSTVTQNRDTYVCSKENYMYLTNAWWTISPYSSVFYTVFFVNARGDVYHNATFQNFGVRPVFYLSPNIKLSGNGSQENPYRIKN